MIRDKWHELIRKIVYAVAEMGSDTVVCVQNTEARESICFSVIDILTGGTGRYGHAARRLCVS